MLFRSATRGVGVFARTSRASTVTPVSRGLCTAAELSEEDHELLNSEREAMEYDVLIVGAGPAGLSAAIRLKQLEAEKGKDISVCVVEKGAEVGGKVTYATGAVRSGAEHRAVGRRVKEWDHAVTIASGRWGARGFGEQVDAVASWVPLCSSVHRFPFFSLVCVPTFAPLVRRTTPFLLGSLISLDSPASLRCPRLFIFILPCSTSSAHILSGNVFEPRALDELIPDWREMDEDSRIPLNTPAKDDKFMFLTGEDAGIAVPGVLLPHWMHNEGNYISSLSQVVRWLGEHAEELGVEIYPGFSASEVVYHEGSDAVKGIATRDVGLNKDGTPKETFMRGMELHGKQVLFGEGCRGSCSEAVMDKYDLREGKDPQVYGIGVKEVWEVDDPENHPTFSPGYIQHTAGWPMDTDTYGGSFLYHMEPNMVLLGFVVGLDYKNPYLSPYEEFQRWKHHPEVSKHLEDASPVAYGARCINEGGLQSIPKLTFPGGALIGCSAGFLNVPKIKGTHTAMKSGMVAAENVYAALCDAQEEAPWEVEDGSLYGLEATGYQSGMEASWVWDELHECRNVKPAFEKGLLVGTIAAGIISKVTKGKEPFTLSHSHVDSETTASKTQYKPIDYPKPDGKLSFDILSNLQRSGTNHEDQPAHLRVKPEHVETVKANKSLKEFDGPEQRFCPAKVYEYNQDGDEPELVINAQNCVHCKCCSIKMPYEYIDWTVPEGGGGPAYTVM